MKAFSNSSYYTDQVLLEAAYYWERKDAGSVPMDAVKLKSIVEDYILSNNTCALATGTGSFVRCTPIEYSWHDGCFWMFSEGGKKFIGLGENPNVSLAIYDKYDGFGNLRSLQVTGRAELVEPFSEKYIAHAEHKKVSLEFLRRLQSPMHLICVHPLRIDCLFSDFKAQGCNPRQVLLPEEQI